MAQVAHIATVQAYENTMGSFTAAIRNEETREVIIERFPTFDAARNFVRTKAWELYGPITFAPLRRKGEYRANVWKEV